jgi:hypothetical protein
MRFRCPVCMFDRLAYPAADYHICPCCGTEFGNDDAAFTHNQLREMWVGSGAHWFFGNPPPRWNPWSQLLVGSQASYVPFTASVRQDANTEIGPILNLEAKYSVSLAA